MKWGRHCACPIRLPDKKTGLNLLAKAGCPKRCLFRPTACAAVRQLAVDHHGGNGTDAQALSPARNLLVIHVEYGHFAGRAGDLVDQCDGFLAGRTTGTEDFNLAFRCHVHHSFCSRFAEAFPWERTERSLSISAMSSKGMPLSSCQSPRIRPHSSQGRTCRASARGQPGHPKRRGRIPCVGSPGTPKLPVPGRGR